jgi:hypothetical protein
MAALGLDLLLVPSSAAARKRLRTALAGVVAS